MVCRRKGLLGLHYNTAARDTKAWLSGKQQIWTRSLGSEGYSVLVSWLIH